MAFGKSQKDAFGTPVGHLIAKATFGTLQTEEWGQFMHICDLINGTEEGRSHHHQKFLKTMQSQLGRDLLE